MDSPKNADRMAESIHKNGGNSIARATAQAIVRSMASLVMLERHLCH